MNLLAVVGSPRKGKSTDVLVDKAIEGAQSMSPDCYVKKLNLIEHRGVDYYFDKAYKLGMKVV